MKIDRSAFLYMDPRGPDKSDFAECGTCAHWIPPGEADGGKGLCLLHEASVKVDADDTCGLYIHGRPGPGRVPLGLTTPQESGLTGGPPRCENCISFDVDDKECGLFLFLNRTMPDDFNLDTGVKRRGCCNAFRPNAE